MVLPENTMSVASQHALQDLVELEMYLVAKSQQTPWPMLPRRPNAPHEANRPYANPVESSAVKELMDQRFIEATSSQTFVVSKTGQQFYELNIKIHSSD